MFLGWWKLSLPGRLSQYESTTLILQRHSDLVNLDCLLRYILVRFLVSFLLGFANLAKRFYSLLTIVLAATSSASSENTLSTHRYKAKSAGFPPKCFRITMNLFYCSVAVVASRCRHVSSHLFVIFFICGALLRSWWMLDNKWILRRL